MSTTVAESTITRNGHLTPTPTLPEARCSVNMRFQVAGYADYAQATGRGDTPEEAARNLKGTVEAVQQAFAPAPEPTREERLSKLLACGTLKAVQRGDYAMIERLTKAFALAVKGYIEPTDIAGAYAVRSMSQSDLWYTVDEAGHCSCPDATHHSERACKHKLALAMWQRVSEQLEVGR